MFTGWLKLTCCVLKLIFGKAILALAAADVNTIRSRAKCTKLYNPGEMTMGKIMDERCRELYYEELRHMELSRVSYIFATTHKSDEFGKAYTVENLSKDSYWYNRVITYNDFYRKKVTTTYGTVHSQLVLITYFGLCHKGDIDANSAGSGSIRISGIPATKKMLHLMQV
jgi:hypothetical protein